MSSFKYYLIAVKRLNTRNASSSHIINNYDSRSFN